MPNILNGFIHIEYFQAQTSAAIFAIASLFATANNFNVVSQSAITNRPGDDESEFTFLITSTPEQFRALIDHLRGNRIRVKTAQLGEPEDD